MVSSFLVYIIFQLAEDGGLDWDALKVALKPQTKCALIQRSCGYSWRRSLSVNDIGRAIKMIKVSSLESLLEIILLSLDLSIFLQKKILYPKYFRMLAHSFSSNMFMQTQNPNCLVMVDNCYGEFVENIEPPMVVCTNICPFPCLKKVNIT